MIWTMLAILTSLCNVSQSTFTKLASSKKETPLMGFNAIKVGAAFVLFMLLSLKGSSLHMPTILFASLYGILLFFSTLFGYLALKSGSMALTSLIVSYSVIIPCLFGFIFLGEALTALKLSGIICLLVSMFLLRKKSENIKTKKGWILYIAITFCCNGACSIIQKIHQIQYPAMYVNEFTVSSLFVAFIIFIIMSITKKETKSVPSKGYGALAGILMGTGNYLTLILSSKMDATVLFPLITISAMLINVTISKLLFKDKFNLVQLLGMALGIVSVLLIK